MIRNFHAMTRTPPRQVPTENTPNRITSMCMEVAAFTHEDCPGGWCACSCHEVSA